MLGDWRSRDRQCLERELRAGWYAQKLHELRAAESAILDLASWEAIAGFLQRGHSTPRGDAILRAIFQAHGTDNDPRWRSILLRLLWPVVEYAYQRTGRLDPDERARWTNAYWVFLRAICRLDVSRRPERIAKKILNDTLHDLRELYRRERRRAADPWPEDDAGRPVEIACRDSAFDDVDETLDRSALLRRLHELRRGGQLSEVDHLLLIGTEVYGRSVQDCAAEAGLSYQAAKKRRQRAIAAIGMAGHGRQET